MGKKLYYPPIGESPFRKADYCCAYFQINRNRLEKIATAAGAKIKISTRRVVYDVPKIEKYLRNEL